MTVENLSIDTKILAEFSSKNFEGRADKVSQLRIKFDMEMNCSNLLFPKILEFIPFSDLLNLQLICKSLYCMIQNGEESGIYWQAVCVNYAKKYGLYHQPMITDQNKAKQHILIDLMPSRSKWSVLEKTVNTQSFKIKTMCRFRPGQVTSGKVLLPLHQFLQHSR